MRVLWPAVPPRAPRSARVAWLPARRRRGEHRHAVATALPTAPIPVCLCVSVGFGVAALLPPRRRRRCCLCVSAESPPGGRQDEGMGEGESGVTILGHSGGSDCLALGCRCAADAPVWGAGRQQEKGHGKRTTHAPAADNTTTTRTPHRTPTLSRAGSTEAFLATRPRRLCDTRRACYGLCPVRFQRTREADGAITASGNREESGIARRNARQPHDDQHSSRYFGRGRSGSRERAGMRQPHRGGTCVAPHRTPTACDRTTTAATHTHLSCAASVDRLPLRPTTLELTRRGSSLCRSYRDSPRPHATEQ